MSEQTRQSKKVVLLDLDGTLTKSDPGIIGCVVKVFEELGIRSRMMRSYSDSSVLRLLNPCSATIFLKIVLMRALLFIAGIMRMRLCSTIPTILGRKCRGV